MSLVISLWNISRGLFPIMPGITRCIALWELVTQNPLVLFCHSSDICCWILVGCLANIKNSNFGINLLKIFQFSWRSTNFLLSLWLETLFPLQLPWIIWCCFAVGWLFAPAGNFCVRFQFHSWCLKRRNASCFEN